MRGRAEHKSVADRAAPTLAIRCFWQILDDVPNRLYRHPVSPGPPNFVDRRNSLPRSIATAASHRRVRLSPNREREPFECASLANQIHNGPMLFALLEMIPMSKPRLHASSSHTPVAMRARLGHAFLSVAHAGACQSALPCSAVTSLPRRMPSFFTL